ncbi:VOC family protein [Arthrobacter sp.]|uniref:VOC family protein n=1 Tax=Arthrobacter sp. TaxID=1667 RepID=UPI0028120A13|nr:VOC family protein [Arthrobacter sp.]
MNPIAAQIGMVFIPVSDLRKARDWYCGMLGVPTDGEILHDHLYVLPMEGAGLILDSKIYSPEAVFQIPAVVFNTEDIQEAHLYMKGKSAEVADVQFDKWFKFKDPDGNLLMICQN